MKMTLSTDRWQEFLGYQCLVEHKCRLHSVQGLLAMERIPVNEYECNYSLNKMISDFISQWKARIYCEVYEPNWYCATLSNGIACDSDHHTKLWLAFYMIPIHMRLEMKWRIILNIYNKVQSNTSEANNKATEPRAIMRYQNDMEQPSNMV